MYITLNKNNLTKYIYIFIFLLLISFILIYLINYIDSKITNNNNIDINTNINNTTSPQINKQANNLSIQTSSILTSNKTIILDAGHGFPDGGATSNDGNIIESTLNLEIVFKLQKLLELSNINVILTRSDENGIYKETAETIREKKVSDMENRVQISKDFPADLFISIHMNKLENTSVKGFQVFYSKKDSLSKDCAKYIQDNLNLSITEFKNTKQIKEVPDIYLSKNLELPFILIECGFLSNTYETSLLQDESYQEKIAWGIYSGIMDFLKS